MKEQKTIAERVTAALTKHGQCSVQQLAKHADTTAGTLYVELPKMAGVRRVKRGLYALANGTEPAPSEPRQRDALASGGELGRKTPYAAALAGLAARRTVLLDEVAKLDRAIEAVEAIA